MSTMVRLNNSIRDHVVRTLLAKKYAADDLAIGELEQKKDDADKAVRLLAYEAAFTAQTRKILESAADGFFPCEGSVVIRIEKGPGNYFDAQYSILTDDDHCRPVPYRNSRHVGSFAAVVDGNSPFAKAVEADKEAQMELNAKHNEVRQKKYADQRRIETIINSVTTVKRLTEVWPEVQEFLPELVSGEGGGVPAQMIADLNKEFGL